MPRITFDSGLSIIFIFMLGGVFSVSTGGFPANRNGDSPNILPLQTNKFNTASSNQVSFLSQLLAGTPLSLSFNVPAAATSAIVLSTNQPGILSNGFKSSFQPTLVLKDSSSMSSASTIKNTASSSAGSVTATKKTDEAPLNTYHVATSVPVNTYNVVSPSVSVNAYPVKSSVPVNTYLAPLRVTVNTYQVVPTPSPPVNTYHVVPPSEEALAQSFSQALPSIPAVKNLLTVPISVSELSNILYTKTTNVLVDIGHSDPHSLATRVSQPVNSFDVFTLPLLFKVIGATLWKFLINEGVEIPTNVSQLYSSYVENYIESNNVSNVDSLIEALWYGGTNFISALGFNMLEKSDKITQLFFEEFTALKN